MAIGLSLLLFPSLTGAAPIISLTDETEQVIGGSVDIWLDEAEQGSFEAVWANASTRGFGRSDKEVPQFWVQRQAGLGAFCVKQYHSESTRETLQY